MPGILISEAVADTFSGEIVRRAPGHALHVVPRQAPQEGIEVDTSVEIAFFSWDVFPDHTGPFVRSVIGCKGLRWLQTFSAGVDNPFFVGLMERGIRLTTGSGSQAHPIAHTVLLYMLALSRDLRGWLDDQAGARWNPRLVEDLCDRRLLVVGLGPIGMEVARLGQAFRMQVTGYRRAPRGDEGFPVAPLDGLDADLPEADYVVLALPLSEATRGLLDARRLALLPRRARIVNVGRGELIDESALVAALDEGRLAGAGLDVFTQEPLPADSPLWRHPHVIVTPHASGTVRENFERSSEIFLENLERYVKGQPLRNEASLGR